MTQPATNLEWVTPRKRARKAAADRVFETAEELIKDGTWGLCSFEELARRSGTSLAMLRARFADKDAVIAALHDRFTAEAAATADTILSLERWEGHSIPEIIREMVAFSVQIFREREALIRALTARAIADQELRERSLQLSRQVAENLRKLILARRKELLHPAPAIAAEFSSRLIHGMLQARTLSGETGEGSSVKLTDEQVTTELVHAVLAYLGVFSTDAWDS